MPHFLFLFFVWYGLFFSSYLPITPCLCNWGAWGRIFLKSEKLIRGELVCFLFLNFDKLLSITAGCSWLNPLSSDGFVSGFLLSFHVTDVICTKHIIDRIVQIGNDQILHVAKGIEFHFGFTYGKEERKKKILTLAEAWLCNPGGDCTCQGMGLALRPHYDDYFSVCGTKHGLILTEQFCFTKRVPSAKEESATAGEISS